MLRQYELVERVRAYDPDVDEALLNRAYVFTVQKHGSQKRASGDPYFSHPVEVAGILTDLHLDTETIVTALLHDTLEDTLTTPEEIERLFGSDVGRLVDGVTKLSKIEAQTENERAAENLRKFLLAMSDDIRVLLVKLADRLHNMRTLHFIKNPEKRRRIAKETMDIYAPLAERIGMYEYMREMQLLAFSELEPEAYATITGRLAKLTAGGKDKVAAISREFKELLAKNGIEADVSGREKHPYSIWRKMQERHVSFEQVTDIIAFRVITPTDADCYAALGLFHRKWKMVPGRFKDYISTPEAQRLQVAAYDDHAPAEYADRNPDPQPRHASAVRIRPRRTLGVQAGRQQPRRTGGVDSRSDRNPRADARSRRVSRKHADRDVSGPHLRLHAEGQPAPAAEGRNTGRFAYAVHTGLGDRTVGAKVNGRLVPLRTQLANGDTVEILSSDKQTPQPAWLGFAVTGKARAAIRRHVRSKEKGRTRRSRSQDVRRDRRAPAEQGWRQGSRRGAQPAEARR